MNGNEYEAMFGKIGLGLIQFLLPYAFQVLKDNTKLTGGWMTLVTLLIDYLIGGLYWTYIVLSMVGWIWNAPNTILFIIGFMLYPFALWLTHEGIYFKLIRPRDKKA
jgi:hypothetical protein